MAILYKDKLPPEINSLVYIPCVTKKYKFI